MDITLIPGIMRNKNWNVGATLMETWFSRPVAVKPAYGNPPVFVKMDWALKYGATKDTYDAIFNDKIWANDAAKKEIRKSLNSAGLLGAASKEFGNLTKSAPDLENDYINYRAVGSYLYYYYDYYYYSGLNDLTAALGRFVLRVCIAGSVAPTTVTGTYQVTVKQVGVYIRDTYDFEGDQDLGYWDAEDNDVSVLNPFAGDKVTNESFRDWRSANGMGGDFLVYSDVKITTLSTPHVFNI